MKKYEIIPSVDGDIPKVYMNGYFSIDEMKEILTELENCYWDDNE